MSLADPTDEILEEFEEEIQLRVTGELREMLQTTQEWIDDNREDWVDHNDDLIFVAYRNALEDELAERELEIETGDKQ